MATSYITRHIFPQQNLEKIQCNSAHALTRAIRETSKVKLYRELGLESFEKDDGIRNCCFYKIFSKESPKYLLNIIPVPGVSYFTRYAENTPFFKVIYDFLKNSFFVLL